jgi:hypothetical protein
MSSLLRLKTRESIQHYAPQRLLETDRFVTLPDASELDPLAACLLEARGGAREEVSCSMAVRVKEASHDS